MVPRRKSSHSRTHSPTTTKKSMMTPATTTRSQTTSQYSSDDKQVSRLLSELRKADSSMDRHYDRVARVMLHQMIAIGVIFLVAMGFAGYAIVRERWG